MEQPAEKSGSRSFLDLREEIDTEDGLRSALRPIDTVVAPAAFGEFVALGPRSTDPDQYALLIESIREGYLLHYGTPRLFTPDIDPDLALLAGDFLYALGLERLSMLGDTEAVAYLADLISLQAVIHADGVCTDSEFDRLDQALWLATGVAVGCGASTEFTALRAEIPGSEDPGGLADRLLAWAEQRAAETGAGEAWTRLHEQVGLTTESNPLD
jgi:hypothetical protein